MDKIWERNPSKSEVIARCDWEAKSEWRRRTDKVERWKEFKKCHEVKCLHVHVCVGVFVYCILVYGIIMGNWLVKWVEVFIIVILIVKGNIYPYSHLWLK